MDAPLHYSLSIGYVNSVCEHFMVSWVAPGVFIVELDKWSHNQLQLLIARIRVQQEKCVLLTVCTMQNYENI